MKRKNLLLIIPELSMGGAQRSLSKLSLEFAQRYNVWLVIFNRDEPVAYSYGGQLLSLDVKAGKSIFDKVISFVQRAIRLRRLKGDLAIDIAISFLEGADYINILSRRREKVILSIRGSKRYDETIKGKFSWIRNKILIPFLYKYVDGIVAVNKGIVDELRTFYGLRKPRILTIGNFYNIEEIVKLSFEPKRENLTQLYSDQILIVTGRLAPEKGLKKLLEIFSQLKKANKKLRFVIVGDGPELSELIAIAESFNLNVFYGEDFGETTDVLFLGSQVNVFKFLRGATVFLMNSSSEGFPNGLVEAMICDVPVVTSDCPYGPREILVPEIPFTLPITTPYFSASGIVMPMIYSEKDIEVWVVTLQNILENRGELAELAKKGKETSDTFDQKMIVKQWYDFLET